MRFQWWIADAVSGVRHATAGARASVRRRHENQRIRQRDTLAKWDACSTAMFEMTDVKSAANLLGDGNGFRIAVER